MAEFEITVGDMRCHDLNGLSWRYQEIIVTFPNDDTWSIELQQDERFQGHEIGVWIDNEMDEPYDIPALIAALQRAQEIAAQWAAEGSES